MGTLRLLLQGELESSCCLLLTSILFLLPSTAIAAAVAAAAMLFELRCSMMVDSNLTSRVNISSKLSSQKWNGNTKNSISQEQASCLIFKNPKLVLS